MRTGKGVVIFFLEMYQKQLGMRLFTLIILSCHYQKPVRPDPANHSPPHMPDYGIRGGLRDTATGIGGRLGLDMDEVRLPI